MRKYLILFLAFLFVTFTPTYGIAGGYAVISRGHSVDLAKTIKQWGKDIKNGAQLRQFLTSSDQVGRKIHNTNILPENSQSFLIALAPNHDQFDQAPITEITLLLCNEKFSFQDWDFHQWRTKQELNRLSQLFDFEALQSLTNGHLLDEWKFLKLEFEDIRPAVHYTSAEWPEYFILK